MSQLKLIEGLEVTGSKQEAEFLLRELITVYGLDTAALENVQKTVRRFWPELEPEETLSLIA